MPRGRAEALLQQHVMRTRLPRREVVEVHVELGVERHPRGSHVHEPHPVGHLAVQMAARTLGAARVISSGSTPDSMALARSCGAHHVFDYKQDDVPAEIMKLTGGAGVDLVYDSTYSETGFVNTAGMVRKGGRWVVLGVGPGKTTRTSQTESPVDAILAERGARHINVNTLKFFSEPETLDDEAKSLLRRALNLAMEWADKGLVIPHIGKTINSTAIEINDGLQAMKIGKSPMGKVAVVVDQARQIDSATGSAVRSAYLSSSTRKSTSARTLVDGRGPPGKTACTSTGSSL